MFVLSVVENGEWLVKLGGFFEDGLCFFMSSLEVLKLFFNLLDICRCVNRGIVH